MAITPFQNIYSHFFTIVTDDMYLEWTKEETEADIENILIEAIPLFEFPRFPCYDYVLSADAEEGQPAGYFNCELTQEEIGILALLMEQKWVERQLMTVDVTKQKYSSKDFELTSQANHMSKLTSLKNNISVEQHYRQRLYKRRKLNDKGQYEPNYGGFVSKWAQ